MTKYGVWFIGNSDEQEGMCYSGKNVFITNKLIHAIDKIDELEYNSRYQLKDHFRVVKIEVLE